MAVLEAAHASATSVREWLDGIADALQNVLAVVPGAPAGVATMILGKANGRYDLLGRAEGLGESAFRVPWGNDAFTPHSTDWVDVDPRVLDGFYQAGIVETRCRVVSRLPQDCVDPSGAFLRHFGMVDSLGLNAPAGSLLLSASVMWPEAIKLAHADRLLLSQIALHLAAGLALLQSPAPEVAVIDARGRLVHATGRAREKKASEPLRRHVAAIEHSRSRRRRAATESLLAWQALVGGHWGLIERTERGGARYYLVLDTPSDARNVRALTDLEAKVLRLSARGTSGKLVAYALGISEGHVSRALQSCAIKIGARSRTEIVRIGAALLGQQEPAAQDARLTRAESAVLDLVRQGLTNAEIAERRQSSVHTVANQVAALLEKMRAPTRRALAARAP